MAETPERGSYKQSAAHPGNEVPSSDDVTSSNEGFLHLTDNDEQDTTPGSQALIHPDKEATMTATAPQRDERAGTIEHLAEQHPFPPLDITVPEMKAHFSALRTEMTRLLTDLRWEGYSIEETAQRLIPLLNVGPVVQWQATLVPFLYEIDRAGALIPAWFTLIDKDDLADLPAGTNPAETPLGRARRYAILLLGKYRTLGIRDENQGLNLIRYLGKLATDPNVSMYATEALVQQRTVPAMQALIEALNHARGWAKVDVIEGCLALKQERFYPLIIASGLKDAPGLESYVALPIYRTVPLERYFAADAASDKKIPAQLRENAALILQRILHASINPPARQDPLPALFSRPFPAIILALFAEAQRTPTWSYALTLHTFGRLMGNYWSAISRHTPLDDRITTQIYQLAPLMNEVERWMAGTGREVLLQALHESADGNQSLIAQTLGELHDPRASALLIEQLTKTTGLTDRTQALTLSTLCAALSNIGNPGAVQPIFDMLKRTVDIAGRSKQSERAENLPYGDVAIPGSIVYAAAIRAAGQLHATQKLEDIWQASHDFDPYVRGRALEALAHLDAQGKEEQSRTTARTALADPSPAVVQQAVQLARQYRDPEAIPLLHQSIERNPALAPSIQETLQTLSQ